MGDTQICYNSGVPIKNASIINGFYGIDSERKISFKSWP